MKKENKILYHFRIHSKQLEYLRTKANDKYTTVTQYILDLISKDMEEDNKIEIKQ